MRLSANIVDSAGSRIIIYGPGGKRPAAPQIEVIDDDTTQRWMLGCF